MKMKFTAYAATWKIGEFLSLYYGPLSLIFLILSLLTKNLAIYSVTFVYLIIFLRKLKAYPNQNIFKCFFISFSRKPLWQVQFKESLIADIYLAENKESPCLIFFYGGGFISGSIKQHQDLCEHWSKGKFHIAYLQYPLAEDGDFQNCLNKTMKAVEQIFSLKTDKFAPSKYSIGGRSAGAYLALQVTCSHLKENIENAILFYPPVKITKWLNLPSSKVLLPVSDLNSFFQTSSNHNFDISETNLNKKTNYYYFLAENDSMVPIGETLKLIDSSKGLSFNVQNFIFKNCNHGFEANPFSLEGQKVCHLIHNIMNYKLNNT